MTVQKRAFISEEGDRWFERNAAALENKADDVVLSAIDKIGLRPTRVLEIGCANGWRLRHLEKLGAECYGVEPSAKAIAESGNPNLLVGTADSLPFLDTDFDLVIFGFCLYLVDPALHFRAVAEADRVLQDRGVIAILDFIPPTHYFNDYSHRDGLRSHKMEFSKYFLASPAYSLVHREIGPLKLPDDRIGVDILAKNQLHAFPRNPY